MTCVLSMTPLYPFNEGGADLQNNRREHVEFHWINTHNPKSGLSNNQRYCSTPFRIDASTSSSLSCRADIPNGLPDNNSKLEPANVRHWTGCEPNLEQHVSANGKEGVNSLIEMCNKTDVKYDHVSTTKYGIKRKVEDTDIGEVYIPSKRVSPFLNTPKERKDERKRIIKLSIKKLKQLDDPEAFLRRTVLVTNTMKRLQRELRAEKLSSRKFESNKRIYSSGYGVLNNNIMSNSYLFDDPFHSGIHEKITDDMTDTLINNVFHDKPEDKSSVSALREESDISDEMEILKAESSVDACLLTSLERPEKKSKPCSTDQNAKIAESTAVSLLRTGLDKRKDIQEICIDRLCEIEDMGKCNVNCSAKQFKGICNDKVYATQADTSGSGSFEVQQMTFEPNNEPANCAELDRSTDVRIDYEDTAVNYSDNKYVCMSSKSAINKLEIGIENNYDINTFDIAPKIKQKSVSHSCNTFLSPMHINQSISVSL